MIKKYAKLLLTILLITQLVPTKVEAVHQAEFEDNIIIESEEIVNGQLQLLMKEKDILYEVEFDDLGVVIVDGDYFTLEDWKATADEHRDSNYTLSFFDILETKDKLELDHPLVQQILSKNIRPLLDWGMTGSGCAVTPPTYGYNNFGSGYGSVDVLDTISTAATVISWISAFVGLPIVTVKSVVAMVANKLYQDALIPNVSAAYKAVIYRHYSTVNHSAVYGASRSRLRMQIKPSNWPLKTGTSAWSYSNFWSVKPC